MTIQVLLSRLEGVRKCGTGYRADCPNDHSKLRGSLSITEVDDGRVMLHCFACNDTPSILRVLGLEMVDLFPERIRDSVLDARKVAAEAFKRNAWGAALGLLDREATVVLIAATDMHEGKALSASDIARLVLAAQRITLARQVLR